jgi:hypothetical protein
LRIHPNIFVISGLLLTPAFFWVLPDMISCARVTGTKSMTQTAGLASLRVIIVGLIVIWTWLVRGSRVAWVIMAVIVWVWAYFIMMGPIHLVRALSVLPEWVTSAWGGEHISRIFFMSTLMFLLMLVGLILPVRSLFRIGKFKYPVPSVKESFGAMEITLIGIGIILGVLLLVFRIQNLVLESLLALYLGITKGFLGDTFEHLDGGSL